MFGSFAKSSLNFAVAAFALLSTGCFGTASAEAKRCYDLSRHEPKDLTGVLDYVLFAGPPNYKDVKKGDKPEPSFVLRLSRPICITGDDLGNATGELNTVQLVESKEISGKLKPLLRQRVTVSLRDSKAATAGHHHEPLVAWVTGITRSEAAMHTDRSGTSATTMTAFYAALADGKGGIASQLVVPEKRARGPFSPEALSSFFGHLKEPIRLLEINRRGLNEFVVHYRYSASTRHCDGRALVHTVPIAGRPFIQGIKALDGC
jgi:hypothetical protein